MSTSIGWKKSGMRSWVVEFMVSDLPIMHRYFTSEDGARRCAAGWQKWLRKREAGVAITALRPLISVYYDEPSGSWVAKTTQDSVNENKGTHTWFGQGETPSAALRGLVSGMSLEIAVMRSERAKSATPSTVGRADSVEHASDPQGAADPRGAPREPA